MHPFCLGSLCSLHLQNELYANGSCWRRRRHRRRLHLPSLLLLLLLAATIHKCTFLCAFYSSCLGPEIISYYAYHLNCANIFRHMFMLSHMRGKQQNAKCKMSATISEADASTLTLTCTHGCFAFKCRHFLMCVLISLKPLNLQHTQQLH